MTTPHPEEPAEGTDDVPQEDPGDDDPEPDEPFLVEEPGALEV